MVHLLIEHFQSVSNLSPDEIHAIEIGTTIKEFKKGDYLLRAGQFSENSYFLLKGCVRQYINLDGDEKTTRFFLEGEWLISLQNADTSSPDNWICMEDCTLVSGDESKARQLFEKFPRLESISRKIVEKALTELQLHLTAFYTDSPETRYQKLLQKRPEIAQRVPQYYIASYVGVKPESLSRIRKRIALKKP